MTLIGVAFLMLILAYRIIPSAFIKIFASFVTIAAGAVRIADYPDDWGWLVFGTAFIFIGLYILFMVAYDFAQERRG